MKTRRERTHLVGVVAAFLALLAPASEARAQFSHTIPIKLPRGANGIQPNIALAYVPGAGNGVVGVGWQLTGLSTITRVNYGNGINYDGGDTYAHSDTGVLVAQADGSYRSKKESFTKLVPSGTCGDGPCSWVAYDRTGLKRYYGITSDSRLLRQGSASVRTWGLAQVVDLFGNSFEVEYTNDAANGEIYPSVVTYTRGSGLTTYRTVEFAYEPRSDVEQGFYQSAFQQTTQRLKWIYVKSGGVLLRQYRLDFECGTSTDSCSGTTTGRSRLAAVTEFGSDGVSMLPAQTFVWQAGSQALGLQSWIKRQGTWRDSGQFLTGDFDGDGKMDIAYVFNEGGGISIDVLLAANKFTPQRWVTGTCQHE